MLLLDIGENKNYVVIRYWITQRGIVLVLNLLSSVIPVNLVVRDVIFTQQLYYLNVPFLCPHFHLYVHVIVHCSCSIKKNIWKRKYTKVLEGNCSISLIWEPFTRMEWDELVGTTSDNP